ITAKNGTVGLAAGHDVLLKQQGMDRMAVKVSGDIGSVMGEKVSGITNKGNIEALGAELRAANGNIYALAINNEGAIRANGIVNEGGRILLTSDGGTIKNAGTLSAKKGNGDGGSIVINNVHSSDASQPSTVLSSGVIEAKGSAEQSQGG